MMKKIFHNPQPPHTMAQTTQEGNEMLLSDVRPDDGSYITMKYPSGVEVSGLWSKDKEVSTWNVKSVFAEGTTWWYNTNNPKKKEG